MSSRSSSSSSSSKTSKSRPVMSWRSSTSFPSTSTSSTCLWLLLSIMLLLIQPSLGQFNRLVACPSNTNIFGYNSLLDLQLDMQEESDAIVAGLKDAAESGYTYSLCPFTTFTEIPTGGLVPLLPKVVIQCGTRGESTDDCILQGGVLHVTVSELSTLGITSYVLERVTLRGIRFYESTFSSIQAQASEISILQLVDCHWKKNSGFAMIAIKRPSSVAVLEEDDGSARRALLRTSTTTRTSSSDKKKSPMQDVFPVRRNLQGTPLDELPSMNVTITDCTMSENFNADDASGFLLIGNSGYLHMEDSVISDNTADFGVETFGGGLSVLRRVSFERNQAVVLVRSIRTSFVNMRDVSFIDNTGATTMASVTSILEADRVLSTGNSMTVSDVFVVSGSVVDLIDSCFSAFDTQSLVFVDALSTYSGDNLYKSNDGTTSFCEGSFVEQPSSTSACLTGGGNACQGVCSTMQADVCSLFPNPTASPTVEPSGAQTLEPTAPTTPTTPTTPTLTPPTPSPTQTSAATTTTRSYYNGGFNLIVVLATTLSIMVGVVGL